MLRIEKKIHTPYNDPREIDYRIYGFRKKTEWEKGRKANTVYCDPLSQEKIVKETFTDFEENDTLAGYDTLIEWFDENGEIGTTQNQRTYLDQLEANEFLTKRRKRAMTIIIHYLLDQAESQEETAELFCLFDFYKSEIDTFINFGGERLKTKLENESNEEINEILGTEVGGQKVREIIINTIT